MPTLTWDKTGICSWKGRRTLSDVEQGQPNLPQAEPPGGPVQLPLMLGIAPAQVHMAAHSPLCWGCREWEGGPLGLKACK